MEHGRHWQLARYELPIKEVERKVGRRRITEVIVGDREKLAYVHRWTGRRVEFTRPRLDNVAPYLGEARAKWECDLAIAESNKREKASSIVGRIQLPRRTREVVEEWKRRAKDPTWIKWPTKLSGVPGAFGRASA